ncbi:hypothetical protein [Streptomyces sp. NPDC001750]|uniref:hypothetical protein n=1 Tax=Streptomyces sp. NPDC001750 TaxID=3364607 RepID=UPI0036C8A2DB
MKARRLAPIAAIFLAASLAACNPSSAKSETDSKPSAPAAAASAPGAPADGASAAPGAPASGSDLSLVEAIAQIPAADESRTGYKRVPYTAMHVHVYADSAGRRVVLRLQVRRFICADTSCGRQTFVEQIPGLTCRHAQRTDRLRSTLAEVGLALAGRRGGGAAAQPAVAHLRDLELNALGVEVSPVLIGLAREVRACDSSPIHRRVSTA